MKKFMKDIKLYLKIIFFSLNSEIKKVTEQSMYH